MFSRIITVAIASLTVSGVANAITVVHAKAKDKEQVIAIDGDVVRMETGAGKNAILFNTKTKDSYIIDSSTKTAVRVNTDQAQALLKTDANANAKPQSVKIDKIGAGPSIAGLPTTQYKMAVANEACGDIYIADNAEMLNELKRLFAAGQNANAVGAIAKQAPCDGYAPEVQEAIMQLGVPLKRTDSKGQTMYEIISIDQKSKLTSADFQVPAGYKVQDTASLLQNALKQATAANKNGTNPDMLKQLNISPSDAQKLMDQMQQKANAK